MASSRRPTKLKALATHDRAFPGFLPTLTNVFVIMPGSEAEKWKVPVRFRLLSRAEWAGILASRPKPRRVANRSSAGSAYHRPSDRCFRPPAGKGRERLPQANPTSQDPRTPREDEVQHAKQAAHEFPIGQTRSIRDCSPSHLERELFFLA